tara:strand:+ start:782 stop:1219 length:438 start_codon:yes stop_codon:yes gene_type:complete
MEDVAELIIEKLKLDNAPSLFELRASARNWARNDGERVHCDVLCVKTTTETGRLVFVVEYLNNHDYYTTETGTKEYRQPWQTIKFVKEDWEGVVGFVTGFLCHGRRSSQLDMHRGAGRKPVASWSLEGDTPRIVVQGAIKALLAK